MTRPALAWEAAFASAHPIRARAALALADAPEPMSPSDLAPELGEPIRTVSYHVRILLGLGALRLRAQPSAVAPHLKGLADACDAPLVPVLAQLATGAAAGDGCVLLAAANALGGIGANLWAAEAAALAARAHADAGHGTPGGGRSA